MGKWDGIKSKINFFWLLIPLETNVLLTMIVICGLEVLLWDAGSSAGRVLEELELKPTQPSTEVRLGLGLRLSLATRRSFLKYSLMDLGLEL